VCTFTDFKNDFLVPVGTYEYQKECLITNARCDELIKKAEKTKTSCKQLIDDELQLLKYVNSAN